MTLVDGDILQITMQGTLLSQRWSNVFYYNVDFTGTPAPIADILANFTLGFIAGVMPIMSASCQLLFTDAKELVRGIDIASGTPSAVYGLVAGDVLPAFVAWSFRLNRYEGTTRHGHKRIAGVTELRQTNGQANGDFMTQLNAAAAFMAAPLIEGDVTCWPVIVGRYPQEHADAGKLNLSVVNGVASVAYIGITTQNTRKPGRGI